MTAPFSFPVLYGADLTNAALRGGVIEAGLRGDPNALLTLRATLEEPTSPSSLSLLSDLIDRGRDFMTREPARGLLVQLAEVRNVLPMIARLMEETGAETLFRHGKITEPPGPMHPDDIALNTEGASRSVQRRFDDFSPEVRGQALALVRRSLAERSEFASLSGRIGDVPLAPTPALTSHEAKQIDTDASFLDLAVKDLYERMIRAFENGKRNENRAAVYFLHTHPLGFGNHGDGRYFTYLSSGDLGVANRYGRTIAERLSSAGFAGGLEVFMGALPVPFRPLGDNLSDRLYVATYRREIP